jgi:hypothetical protein
MVFSVRFGVKWRNQCPSDNAWSRCLDGRMLLAFEVKSQFVRAVGSPASGRQANKNRQNLMNSVRSKFCNPPDFR